jgi:hypothetical protein
MQSSGHDVGYEFLSIEKRVTQLFIHWQEGYAITLKHWIMIIYVKQPAWGCLVTRNTFSMGWGGHRSLKMPLVQALLHWRYFLWCKCSCTKGIFWYFLVHNGQGLWHSILLYECHPYWFTMGWTSPRPLCRVRCCASPFGWAWWCTQHNGQRWDHSMTWRTGVLDSTI